MKTSSGGFNELIGMRLCGGEDGRYQLELPVDKVHCHDAAGVHGGVYLSLLDTVMSRALRTVLDESSYAPTLTLNASFFRPVSSGTIRAEGVVVNQSRRTAFVEGRLFDDNGKLLAQASGNFFLIAD